LLSSILITETVDLSEKSAAAYFPLFKCLISIGETSGKNQTEL